MCVSRLLHLQEEGRGLVAKNTNHVEEIKLHDQAL